MRWVQWLEEEQRHLIWMRAKRYAWQKIAKRFGCCTRTAQRRWQRALQVIADHLSQGQAEFVSGHLSRANGGRPTHE